MPSEAQKRANYKYQEKMNTIRVWCTPEEKKIITDNVKAAGKSVNRYILDLTLGEGMVKNE